jgi:regulator of nonsense transcripts 3
MTEQTYLDDFSEKSKQWTFVDAKKTMDDPALIGPPQLIFAPYQRITAGKQRNDPRQGTIDQDPNFQNFLENLTRPAQKPATVDAERPAKKEAPKTTPIIEDLRAKKAARGSAAAKAAPKHGRHDTKESKGAGSDKAEKKAGAKGKETLLSPEKSKRLSKADRAAKEAVKVLTREASAVAQTSEKGTAASASSTSERRRETVAKPINVKATIMRDLGKAPAGGRRAKRESASSETSNSQTSAQSTNSQAIPEGSNTSGKSNPTPSKDSKASRNRRASKSTLGDKSGNDSSPDVPKKIPTGPAAPTILKKPTTAAQAQPPKGPAAAARVPTVAPKTNTIPTGPSSTTADSSTSTPSTPTAPASTGRQAFLKHANPSQGITEPLIEEALKTFGGIEKVEIDRKKGFAYVDFADAEGLRKAVAASPIKVAQGAVQVLERRDRAPGRAPVAPMAPRGGFRGGRGGRGRGIGRGGMGGPVSPSVASPTTTTAGTPPPPVTPAAPSAAAT